MSARGWLFVAAEINARRTVVVVVVVVMVMVVVLARQGNTHHSRAVRLLRS